MSRRKTSRVKRPYDDDDGDNDGPSCFGKWLRAKHLRPLGDDAIVSCKICMSNIRVTPTSSLAQCPVCADVFHDKCFRKFLGSSEQPLCPNCRVEVTDDEEWICEVDVFDSDDEDFEEAADDECRQPQQRPKRSCRRLTCA
jgi:hypothetical protein